MKNIPSDRRAYRLWLLCCALVIWGGGAASAQETPKVPFTGFTRPGSPEDERLDGKIVTFANNPDLRKTAMGGTVYFRVIERGPDGWGDAKEFVEFFQAGIDGGGVSSPTFDATAKYLYLYQVVNDRRTATPLQSVSIKLIVDVKDITSWGYFQGVGFGTVAKKEQPQAVVQPVAFNHVLVGGDPDIFYRRRAPAVPLEQPLRLARVPTERGEKEPGGKQKPGPIKIVWDALDPANNPDHVMLLSTSDFDKKPCFRAVWNAATALKRDGRSTVFGFTSNLPPKLEPVRLRGFLAPDKDNQVKPAVEADVERKLREATVLADGQAPSPVPEFPVSEEEAPPGGGVGMPGGGTGGVLPGGGSSVPLPFRGGAGGGSGGGAGVGGGSGSNRGSVGTTSNTTGQTQTNTGTQQIQTINFNPTLTNSQSQQQQQQQQQQQTSCCTTTPTGVPQTSTFSVPPVPVPQISTFSTPPAVVPLPATLLLAALGLPALLLVRRKRRAVKLQESEA